VLNRAYSERRVFDRINHNNYTVDENLNSVVYRSQNCFSENEHLEHPPEGWAPRATHRGAIPAFSPRVSKALAALAL